MNLQSSSINMFLLNDSETLMQIFTFFIIFLKKATNDWVNKNNNEPNLQQYDGHSLKRCYVTSRSGSSRHFTHSMNTQIILRYHYVFW